MAVKAKIKKFIVRMSMFGYGAAGVISIIYFITGAVRCCIHFIEGTNPTFLEYLGLFVIALISGVAGIALYEIDAIDTDE